MTSKEALCYLDDIAHGRKMEYDPHELKCIVEKDLEVLEIIKKYLVRIFDYPEGGDYFCLELHKFIYEKEGIKFKEWLENDK